MSISDMMSGLMLVFLFIAIGFMIEMQSQKDSMKEIASSYRDTKANLNEVLYDEFEEDLKVWDADITKDNSIIFNSPEVLFAVNSSKINPEFKKVLAEFFPRYVNILTSKQYKDEVKEVRVEGHTSNTWANTSSKKDIYLNNMKLSQSRAYEVLSYCYSLEDNVTKNHRAWIEKFFRANGMAYAKLKNLKEARRVEFKVELKSENRVYEILKKGI
jgi:outer membrane protein OmpA-like peptidoglycan-associated protein